MTAALEGDRLRLPDHETAVVDLGEGGVPMVLIHSLGLDWRMSRDVLPAVARTRRVLAYDLRLHGIATDVDPETFTLPRCADDVAALLDALGIARAHVVGFSLGGAVAQLFALRHPDRLAGLGLVCTMARAPRDTYLGRAAAAEREGMEAQIVPTMTRWFSTAAPAKSSWGVRYARERVRQVPPARWARYWRALSEIDVLDELGRIEARTRVIAAEDDRSTPPSSMRPIAAAIPRSTFHVIPGAPHMVSLACPDAIASLLAEWDES